MGVELIMERLIMNVVDSIVVPVSVLAGASWILRAYIKKSFDKDIERYKKELEVENDKARERFSFVYQKKCVVFELLFEKAMETSTKMLGAIKRERPDQNDIILEGLTTAAEKVSDFGVYKNSKVLFFASNVNEKAGNLHEIFRRNLEQFSSELDGVVKFTDIKNRDRWDEMVENFKDEAGGCLESLRNAIHEDLEI